MDCKPGTGERGEWFGIIVETVTGSGLDMERRNTRSIAGAISAAAAPKALRETIVIARMVGMQ